MRRERVLFLALLLVLSFSLLRGEAIPAPVSAAPAQVSQLRTFVYTVGIGLLARFDAAVIDTVWQAGATLGYARDVLHDKVSLSGVGTAPVDFDFTLDGQRVYVPETNLDRVAVIDTAGPLTVVGHVPVGPYPVDVAIGPAPSDPSGHPGYAYVTNKNNVYPSGSISVIDTATEQVIVTVTDMPGQGPTGIDVAPDGSRIYVMVIKGAPTYEQVWVMETAAILDQSLWNAGENTVSADRLVADQRVAIFSMAQTGMRADAQNSVWPRFSRINVTPDGTAAWFVAQSRHSAYVIDNNAGYMRQFHPIYDAREVAFAPDQSLAYLVGGAFQYIDSSWNGPACGDPTWICTLFPNPQGIPGGSSVAFGPDGDRAYVLKHHIGGFGLAVIDTATHYRIGYVGSDTGFLGTHTVRVAREPEGGGASNALPVANAGPDQQVPCAGPDGATVTLDGSGSNDSDGQIVSYLWSTGGQELGTGASLDVSLPAGSHTVTLTVMDDLGEQASDDVVIEVLTCPANSAPVADAGADQVVGSAGPDSASVTLDGSSSQDPDGDPLSYWWSWGSGSTNSGPAPTVSLGLGEHTITLVVNDGVEDSAPDEVIVTIVDDTPPVLSGAPGTLVIEQEGLEGTPKSSVDFSAVTATDGWDGDLLVSDDAPDVFPVGDTIVTFTATDAAGNTTNGTTTVTVHDSQPPEITGVPEPMTVEGNTQGGAVVDLGSASGTDLVDSSVEVLDDAPDVFPVGDTVVTFTATDAAGNTTNGSTTVTVVDTTPPVLQAPGSMTIETTGPLGAPSNALNLSSVTASDLVDPSPVVEHDAPSSLPLGQTVVTFTATDAAGNTASASTTVTVVDTTAPEITAALVPLPGDGKSDDKSDDKSGKSDDKSGGEGKNRFRVAAQAADIGDDSPTVVADINGISVLDGQQLVIKLKGKSTKVKVKDGVLEIETPRAVLTVTATDASGNSSSDQVVLLKTKGDDGGSDD